MFLTALLDIPIFVITEIVEVVDDKRFDIPIPVGPSNTAINLDLIIWISILYI